MNSYSSESNRQLIELAQNGTGAERESATEKLICDNMGLVRHIALKFCGRGCEYEDLVQIGLLQGLFPGFFQGGHAALHLGQRKQKPGHKL